MIRPGIRARSSTSSVSTHPGVLGPAVSASSAAVPVSGATVPSAAMTPDQNDTGSLSPSPTDSHAAPESCASHQSRSSDVFPHPAGATVSTSRAVKPSASRSSSACRATVSGGAAGGRSTEVTTKVRRAPPSAARGLTSRTDR